MLICYQVIRNTGDRIRGRGRGGGGGGVSIDSG
jgi:hypothetical protein